MNTKSDTYPETGGVNEASTARKLSAIFPALKSAMSPTFFGHGGRRDSREDRRAIRPPDPRPGTLLKPGTQGLLLIGETLEAQAGLIERTEPLYGPRQRYSLSS